MTVNQRIMGGQWVLLGSYTMNASTAYAIALSDNPNGPVAADAVRVVPVASSTEKFTWTPTIPSSGSYDVYARWVSSSANTGSATYTVTHAGGTTTVVVNQKQNGSTWVKLGTYSFAPSSGHKVELLGANDGRVIADGIRLVSASAQAANIAYIHTDHLGSPQKMTDTSQALTWDAQFDPFGEEHLITGSATNPNRFPGQYADAETGYSYNYFRDYEPTIGRYVQSDSIGLTGGMNLFSYVGNAPTARIDPLGLKAVCTPLEKWTDPQCSILEGGGGGGSSGGEPLAPYVIITGIFGIIAENLFPPEDPANACPVNEDEDEDEVDCDEWLKLLKQAYQSILDYEALGMSQQELEILKREHNASVMMFCMHCPDECPEAPRFGTGPTVH